MVVEVPAVLGQVLEDPEGEACASVDRPSHVVSTHSSPKSNSLNGGHMCRTLSHVDIERMVTW
eukprot:3935702-Pyramimonas_sp.AAC.2